MSDTLEEMKKRLKKHQATLAEMKKEATSINSLGGKTVVKLEEYRMAMVEHTIQALADKIKERERLLSTVDMQDVINHYDGLFQRIDISINNVHQTYLSWQAHIYNVGTYYDRAYKTFNKTVVAQDKYKADLANIAASIISIAGVGTLSWLSTTGKLAATLSKINLGSQANIIEDIAQSALDKYVSYKVPKIPDGITTDFPGPVEFQNQISLKAIKSYKAIHLEISRNAEAVALCRAAIVTLQTKKIGNAKEQFEKYIKFENGVGTILAKAETWTKKLPPKISAKALTDDFERSFWAGWIPRLKNEKTRIHTGHDEFGVEDPNYGETYTTVSFDTWFSSDLKNRLYALIDMKKIGVGKDGLQWVSTNDVKLLIAWANKFKFSQTF